MRTHDRGVALYINVINTMRTHDMCVCVSDSSVSRVHGFFALAGVRDCEFEL